MHISKVQLHRDTYPSTERYPFNLKIFHETESINFDTNVTFFVGDNGAGKSTLLEAIAKKCGIHIWGEVDRARFERNPLETLLYRSISVEWSDGVVPGSFFASQIFRNFAKMLDEWAVSDPDMLNHFGGKSLITQSHGQSLMSYFKSRYKIRGLYFLDEPETALSPASQIELVKVVKEMSDAGHAQFIIATHSPIVLACPGATIYDFNTQPVSTIEYDDIEHVKTFKAFMENPGAFF